MIELDGLTKCYGAEPVLADLCLEVRRGELLVLLGASGSGKTTTLKLINRLIEPTRGCVMIAGRDVSEVPAHELRRRLGYCFQEVGLFPHMTVAENIGITPELLGWSAERVRRRVDELLELVALEPASFRGRSPRKLSGGQAQRVGIARALAAEPDVLLMDEPFAAVDPLIRDRLQRALISVRKRLGITTVFVTHDIAEALLLADRIAVLDAGRLVQLGTPQELLTSPANEAVAQLIDTPRRHAERVAALLRGGGRAATEGPPE